MKPKFENPTPLPRPQLEIALASSEASVVAEALIRIALWENDWRWAEHKSFSALKDAREEVRTAALLAIGHLARLHRSLDLQIVVPAVRKLLADTGCHGTAEDVLDDIASFMPEASV